MKNFLIIISLTLFTSSFAANLNQPQATHINIFNPFSAEGINPNLKVSNTIEGYCWTTSLRTSQPNAWRCMAGNAIHDPCFVNPANRNSPAICVDQPWKTNVIAMKLTKPLPRQKFPALNIKKTQPWIIELSNGQYCQFLTGATSGVQGMRINYGCDKDTYILGDLDKSKPLWHANYYHIDKPAAQFKKLPVKAVWY